MSQATNMDTSAKDSIANVASAAGMGLTFMDIQGYISILVLITALILNVGRIYTWWTKK